MATAQTVDSNTLLDLAHDAVCAAVATAVAEGTDTAAAVIQVSQDTYNELVSNGWRHPAAHRAGVDICEVGIQYAASLLSIATH